MANYYAWATAGTTQDWNDSGIWSTSSGTDPATSPGSVPGSGDVAYVGSWARDFVIQLTSYTPVDTIVNWDDWRSSNSGSINCRIETDGNPRVLELLSTTLTLDDFSSKLSVGSEWIRDQFNGHNLDVIMHGPTRRAANSKYLSCRDLTLKSNLTSGDQLRYLRWSRNLTVEYGADVTMSSWGGGGEHFIRTWTIDGTVNGSYVSCAPTGSGVITLVGSGTWNGGFRSRAPIDFGTEVDFSNSNDRIFFENETYALPILTNGHDYSFWLDLGSPGTLVLPSSVRFSRFDARINSNVDFATNNSQVIIDTRTNPNTSNTSSISTTGTITSNSNSEILCSGGPIQITCNKNNVNWRLNGIVCNHSASTASSNVFGNMVYENNATAQFSNTQDYTCENFTMDNAIFDITSNADRKITVNGDLTLTDTDFNDIISAPNQLTIWISGGTQNITGSSLANINGGMDTIDARSSSNTNLDDNSAVNGLASGPYPNNNNVQFAGAGGYVTRPIVSR